MRPLEIVLSLTNLLTCFVLAIPLPRAVFWMRYWVPIALLIAVAQVLLEGPRWQLVPAYALIGLFLLIWLVQHRVPTGRPAGQQRTNRLVAGRWSAG